MSRFGTSIYGTDKWGTSEPNVNLIWGFEINWTGDSPDFDGSNEAPRLLSFRTERGRDHVFTADNKAFEPYQVGEASFVVDNRDGRYNPYNTTSELYGNCIAGKFVRFGVNKVDPLFSENVRNYIFSGIIDSIPLDTESKTATINVKDGWQYLQDHTPSSELRVRNSVFDIATMIIESISWPWAYVVNTVLKLPTFTCPYFFCRGNNAALELWQLGRDFRMTPYIAADGTLYFT